MELKEWKGNMVEVVDLETQSLETVVSFVKDHGYNVDPHWVHGVGHSSLEEGCSWFVPVL